MKVQVSILLALLLYSLPVSAETVSEEAGKSRPAFDNQWAVVGLFQMRAVYHGSSDSDDRINDIGRLNDIASLNDGSTGYTDFRARQIRMGVKGSVNKIYKYLIEFKGENLIREDTNGGIQEASLIYQPRDEIGIKFGGFKVPFAREHLTSARHLTTLERSLITNTVGHVYDTGVSLQGRLFNHKLTYSAGIFNGDGSFINGVNGQTMYTNASGDVVHNTSLMYAGRLQYDPLGEYRNGLAQFSKASLVSVGVGSYYQSGIAGTPIDFGVGGYTEGLFAYTADVGFQYRRISLEGGWLAASGSYKKSFSAAAANDRSLSGYYGQVGYFILVNRLQAWLKYEQFQDDVYTGSEAESQNYASAGINVFPVEKHLIKLQLAYMMGLNSDSAGKNLGIDDDWAALQAQISF